MLTFKTIESAHQIGMDQPNQKLPVQELLQGLSNSKTGQIEDFGTLVPDTQQKLFSSISRPYSNVKSHQTSQI